MEKKYLREYNLNNATPIALTQSAAILKLNNGNILKVFHPQFLGMMKLTHIDIEAKILDAKPIKHSPEILVPTSALYDEKMGFIGYSMPEANGIDYNEHDDKLTIGDRKNLKKYAIEHAKLEAILKRNKNIVFPDFCTCDNIFTDGNNFQIIDYDGLQIDNHKSIVLSTSLGNEEQYFASKKYWSDEELFTKELDKKSSIILYFLTTFNVDLNTVGMIPPNTDKPITLDDVFDIIKLDDSDLCHKVWKLFQDNESNEYLGDTVFRIADKYNMEAVKYFDNRYLKVLTKK